MTDEDPLPDPVTKDSLCLDRSPLNACYRVIDETTGAIEFDTESEGYRFYRKHLLSIRVDIDTIRNQNAFDTVSVSRHFINTTMSVIRTKWTWCTPRNLKARATSARLHTMILPYLTLRRIECSVLAPYKIINFQ
jgi:hypothetical protein